MLFEDLIDPDYPHEWKDRHKVGTIGLSLERLGLNPNHELWTMYAEPQRFYHTIQHIVDTFEVAHEIGKGYSCQAGVVYGALAFHDCVYTVGGKQNEELSALYAILRLMDKRGEEETNAIAKAIRKTANHLYPASLEEAIVMDCDLWCLGAEPEEFEVNTDNILKEYLTVYDLDQVKAGRVEWIDKFLKRDKIYYTAAGAEREEQARRNLTREMNLFQASLV